MSRVSKTGLFMLDLMDSVLRVAGAVVARVRLCFGCPKVWPNGGEGDGGGGG